MAGCGGSDIARGSVEGKVTLDGTDVEKGTITFLPTAGTIGPDTYGTILNGKYSVMSDDRGPIVGKHRVRIEAMRYMGKKHPTGAPLEEQVVPEKFNKQTTLVVEITKGNNHHDFALTSK
jgi:hypothetical protein